MTARFHLQPLLDLANTRTDEAARKLGELVAAERDVEQKLKMLEDYRQEYNERFVQAARDGLSPDAWRNYSAFINKLENAATQQYQGVLQVREALAECRTQWLEAQQRRKAVELLLEKKADKVPKGWLE